MSTGQKFKFEALPTSDGRVSIKMECAVSPSAARMFVTVIQSIPQQDAAVAEALQSFVADVTNAANQAELAVKN